MRQFLLITVLAIVAGTANAQVTYTWNGSASGNWNTASNWSPNGIPATIDNIIIVTGANSCRLQANSTVANMTMNSGVLDLAGYQLSVNGTVVNYNLGTILPGRLLVNSAGSVAFGNGPLVFNCKTSITAATVLVRNTRFEDSLVLLKTGNTNDGSAGNNIFNAPLDVTNSGGGFLALGTTNADQFNAPSVFNNNGTNSVYVAHAGSGHVFNAPTFFNNNGTGAIYVSNNSTSTVFNADLTLTSTAGQGIQFCNGSAASQVTMAAGTRIKIGAAGFNAGYLQLRQFIQNGSTAQNLALAGSATLRIGPAAVFAADFTAESPGLLLNGGTFNALSTLKKTGSSGDFGSGSNIFNGTCSITNSGTSYLVMGNSTADTWNGDVTFTNNGSERILPCWNAAGNQFRGNIYINSSDTARGIQFCGGNSTATATLAAGKTILPGTVGLTAGYLYLKQFTQLGTVPLNITGTGLSTVYLGPSSEFSAPVTVTAPNIYCQGAVYHAPASFTKTGGNSNHNNQYTNTFESTCTIDQQSNGGYFMIGYRANDQFLDDIIVSSSGTGEIYLGHSSYGSAPTLAAGKTIRVGPSGYSAGILGLRHFTQLGTMPIQLDFTGSTTMLLLSDSSIFGGNFVSTTPALLLNGATFKRLLTATKTGTSNDQSSGGNIFEGAAKLVNSGSGYLSLGHSRPDSFYVASHFEIDGSSYINLAANSADNYFGSDITLSSWNTSRGINFCNSSSSTAYLKAGGTITIGTNGFSSGSMNIRRFTQLGTKPVNMALSGSGVLTVGPDSRIGGNIVASAPSIQLNGCEYLGTSEFLKTGSSNDYSDGGNIFQGVSKVSMNGTGFFLLGNSKPDTWNNDLTLSNSGSEKINLAWGAAGNLFNGNIYLNTTASAAGIRFCGGNTTATATLATGKTIAVGTDGFIGGHLQLRQFTQLGTVPVNLSFGSAASYIQYGPSSVFNGDVTSSSPGLYFNGTVFNGKVTSTKTGGNTDYSTGGNVFNGEAIISNSGTSSLVLANSVADSFRANSVFNNNGSSNIYVANNGTGNLFRGISRFNNTGSANTGIYVSPNAYGTLFEDDIIVSSTVGNGVQFCNNAGTATLNSGHTVSIGSSGFSAGQLLLRQFTQLGTTSQVLNLTGTAMLTYGPSSSFGGSVTSVSPGVFVTGSTFNGAALFTKTGTSNDNSAGGNSFNSSSGFINQGTGQFLLANINADTHAGNVSFIQSSTGRVYPNYNANATYAGNVYIESPAATAIVFGAGAGTAILNGAGAQVISAGAGAAIPVFSRLVLANTGSGATLNTNINIQRTLALSAGLLHTSTTNILTMLNASTTAAGTASSTSYIDGPMRYQKSTSGSTVLNFPIGNSADCRPVILTLSHTNGTLYTYQAQLYNASAKALGYSLPASISKVSEVHYYTINRFNAAMVNQPVADLSGSQGIEIFFGLNDMVTDGSQVRVVKNTYTATTSWIDIGGSGAPSYSGGAPLAGSVHSTSGPSSFNSFSTFALGNLVGGINVLPVKLLSFGATVQADGVDLAWSTSSETDNSHFTIERSTDAATFTSLARVDSKAPGGTSNSILRYGSTDAPGLQGISYYRLRQTDLFGKVSYSQVISVNRTSHAALSVYPNPINNQFKVTGIRNGVSTIRTEWYDMAGKLAASQRLNVSGNAASAHVELAAGVYSLRIVTDDGTVETRQVLVRGK